MPHGRSTAGLEYQENEIEKVCRNSCPIDISAIEYGTIPQSKFSGPTSTLYLTLPPTAIAPLCRAVELSPRSFKLTRTTAIANLHSGTRKFSLNNAH